MEKTKPIISLRDYFCYKKKQSQILPSNNLFKGNKILKDALKTFDDFKNKQQKCMKKYFLICKSICILKMYSIRCTLRQNILKKFPSDNINGTEKAVYFLSWAPTHHSFTFNLRFLNELKRNVCLSKIVCGIFHFRFCFIFIKVYISVQQNAWTLWL